MRKKVVGKALALLTSVLMVLGSLGSSASVNAKSFVNPDTNTGSISVSLKAKNSETVVSGGTLHLVQIAGATDEDNGLVYQATDAFANYVVNTAGDKLSSKISSMTEEELAEDTLAEGMETYAVENSLTGTTQTVGTDGTVKFTGVGVGLWLIYQQDSEAADGFLPINPFLVTVPQIDSTKSYGADTGYYVFDVEASPKVEAVSESTTFVVNKVWADANNFDGSRPETISMQLYADQPVDGTTGTQTDNGYAYGSAVELTGDGNTWSYTWGLLPGYYEGTPVNYKAVEVTVPDGYTSETSSDGHTITNTHDAGEIVVTKRLMVVTNAGILEMENAVDGTFYVALFSDAAYTTRVSDVKEITFSASVSNSVSKEVTFSGLALGTYYVAETDADGNAYAAGSTLTEQGTEYTVLYSNDEITLTEDDPDRTFDVQNCTAEEEQYSYDGSVTVNKSVVYGADGNDLASDYPDSEKVFYFGLYDASGSIVEVKTLDYAAGDRSVTFTDLPVATDGTDTNYTVKEVDSPEKTEAVPVNESSKEFSYTPDTVSQDVVLKESADQAETTFTNTFTKEEETETEPEETKPEETEPEETEPEETTEEETGKGRLTLEKVDADDGDALEGAVFAIYSDYSLRNKVDEITTDEDGEATSKKLAAGTYYVKEIQAPDNYRLESDNPVYTVKVKDGETVSVTSDPIENSKKTVNRSVSTGVQTHQILFGGLALLAAVALVVLVVRRRKEEN